MQQKYNSQEMMRQAVGETVLVFDTNGKPHYGKLVSYESGQRCIILQCSNGEQRLIFLNQVVDIVRHPKADWFSKDTPEFKNENPESKMDTMCIQERTDKEYQERAYRHQNGQGPKRPKSSLDRSI